MAAASGDGITSIVQNILVANMGVAGANTGVNSLGGGYATLDPQTAGAVVRMAAFLASLLSVVHQGATSTMLAAQSAGIEIPFGDLVLTVGGLLSGFDTQLTSATGARANIRQISIVLSLGLARANTGNNVVQTQTTPDGLPAATPALQSTISAERQAEVNTELAAINAQATGDMVDNIATGPSDVGNKGNLVVICQRINANDIDCLAPPPPPVEPPADTPPTTTTPEVVTPTTEAPAVDAVRSPDSPVVGMIPAANGEAPQQVAAATSDDSLPSTGTDVEGILFVAGCMLTIGICVLIVFRRKPLQKT
jgi:LPXTG-motif cell wall-anchored protein